MAQKLAFGFLTSAVLFCGCGGGGSQQPPPPPVVAVAISTMPPSALSAGGTATVSATVTNDTANAGVNWSCSPMGSCGSFNPASTASGSNSTYTAPGSVPAGGSVTITATSVTDAFKKTNASVTIRATASLATLKGQYAFFLAAPTGNANTASRVGSVTLDGAGKITAGVQDYGPGVSAAANINDVILSGSYTLDPNGHGTMTCTTTSGKTLKFSFALTSSSHALLIETDGNPGSGTLDLQSAGPSFTAALFSGAYSFTMTGMDPVSMKKVSNGGIFTAQGSSATVGGGTLDVDNGGVSSTTFFGGSFGVPDPNGRGTMTWNDGVTTRHFAYYIVTPKVLLLFETDGIPFIAGTAYAQGSLSTGTTNAALNGKYVFQAQGWSGGLGRTIIAGQVTSNGTGLFTSGIADSVRGHQIARGENVSGSYSFSGSPRSTGNQLVGGGAGFVFHAFIYLVDPSLNMLDPNSGSGGGGALLMSSDSLFVDGIGMLIPQSVTGSPAFASGNHALNLTNIVDDPVTPPLTEVDLAGIVTSNGAGSLTGSADTGTVTADAMNSGRFTGMLTVPQAGAPYGYIFGFDAFNVSLYQISNSQAVIFVTDQNAINADMECTGYLLQQIL